MQDEHHVTALASYGAFLFDVMGDVRGARELLQRAVRLAPHHAPSLTSLAAILQSEGAHPEAVEEVFLRAILAHQELLSKHLTLHEGGGLGMQGVGGLYMDQGTAVDLDGRTQNEKRVASAEAASCCSSFAGWLWEVRNEASRAATLWGAALSIDPSNLAALRGASRLFAHVALSSSCASEPAPLRAEREGKGATGKPAEGKPAQMPASLGARAEELYMKAISLEPRHVATRYNYAAFLHRLASTHARMHPRTARFSPLPSTTACRPSASASSNISSASTPPASCGGASAPCGAGFTAACVGGGEGDLSEVAKLHYWEVLRLYPAHPPALCSLAALLQAEAENLKLHTLGKEGAFRQCGGGGGDQTPLRESGGCRDVAGAVCASGAGRIECASAGATEHDAMEHDANLDTDCDADLASPIQTDTSRLGAIEQTGKGGEEAMLNAAKKREKLIFMTEELLLTAAEVVERVTYDASGAVVQQSVASSSDTVGQGARGERWAKHKADVWTAYGGFLDSCKEDVSGAARAYLEALKADPQHGTALLQYGELAAVKMKNPRVAEYLYRQLLNVVPGVPDHWRGYGEVLQQVGNDAEAELAFKRALQMAPSDPSVLCSYATVLQSARRDCGGAETLYQQALNAQPQHTAALSNYGLLLEEFRADYTGAEQLYRRALAVDPQDVTVLCHLALLRQDAFKDIRGAEALFAQALQFEPASVPALSNMASFQFAERHNVDYAEKLFKRALRASPADVATLINYGSLLEEGRRDRARAQEMFDLAMEIDPLNAERYLEQRDAPKDLGSESDLDGAPAEEVRECRGAGSLGQALRDGTGGDEPRIQVLS
jgi:tetratricopeptide (TPR) repeat protein